MTEKTINIAGIDCRFKASAAIPRIYRRMFGQDIFTAMSALVKHFQESEKSQEERGDGLSTIPFESLEVFENIAYVMHKHGDPSQPDDIDEWLEQFDTFDVYTLLPEIIELWHFDNKQLSVPKKKARQ